MSTKKSNQKSSKRSVTPTKRTVSSSGRTVVKKKDAMLFDKQNYMLMGLGILLIVIGFFLMSGGPMDPNELWGENPDIYSFRRITLAPFIVLAGLGLQVYAIFKR